MCINLYIAFDILSIEIQKNADKISGCHERKGDNMADNFKEIIGYEDIKKELDIIIDMMNNTEQYRKMGASLEKGLILEGKPGTGKTTMANCLVNAITTRKCFVCRKKNSDGQFVDEIVKTFEEAKNNAPSIVFLDDVDKFAEKGSNGIEDNDPEEFVAIQSCMDEVKDMDVFVIATANKIHKLPDSLIRPGRLGKVLTIRLPKPDESEKIINHYLEKTNAGTDLDSVSISKLLYGETCATLENVIARAAAKATFNRQKTVTMKNIVDACLDMVFDSPEYDKKISEETLRRIAYHEAGHAIASELLDPGSVSIASIRMSSGDKLGFVRYCREDDDEITFDYFQNQLKTSLAGRAATEIVYGETDLGANNDLHNAFEKARRIVDNYCTYGFSNWIEDCETSFSAENRNRTMALIMEQNYQAVKKLLIQNRALLDCMTEALMERTTLIYSDIQAILRDKAS